MVINQMQLSLKIMKVDFNLSTNRLSNRLSSIRSDVLELKKQSIDLTY